MPVCEVKSDNVLKGVAGGHCYVMKSTDFLTINESDYVQSECVGKLPQESHGSDYNAAGECHRSSPNRGWQRRDQPGDHIGQRLFCDRYDPALRDRGRSRIGGGYKSI